MTKTIELPETIEKEIFFHLRVIGYDSGQLSFYSFEKTYDNNTICIGSQMVTFNIPQKVDIKAEILEVLEKEKISLKAKHHMELKKVQDKIDNLLAIEYKPEGKE